MKFNSVEKYDVYIGLKDNEELIEKYTIEDFTNFLSKICTTKEIGFSLTTQYGGYKSDMGYYTENSLRITLLGIKEEEVKDLALELKKSINAKAVMVTKETCDCTFF